MFAVIKTGGKQYCVVANDLIKVEKLIGEAGDLVQFSEILMIGEGAQAAIGAPTVAGALVTAEIIEQGRAKKVIAFKKRRRQNSKRTRGHRQYLSTIRIVELLTDGAKPTKTAADKPVRVAKPASSIEPVIAPIVEAPIAAEKTAVTKPKKAAKSAE
jgi:large subunit ribosomal protein L21